MKVPGCQSSSAIIIAPEKFLVVESFQGISFSNLMLVMQQYVKLSKACLETYKTKAMKNG